MRFCIAWSDQSIVALVYLGVEILSLIWCAWFICANICAPAKRPGSLLALALVFSPSQWHTNQQVKLLCRWQANNSSSQIRVTLFISFVRFPIRALNGYHSCILACFHRCCYSAGFYQTWWSCIIYYSLCVSQATLYHMLFAQKGVCGYKSFSIFLIAHQIFRLAIV